MFVVTGAAGFIGSNLIRALNARGIDEIVAVDDLTHGDKFKLVAESEIYDYLDKEDFIQRLADGDFDGRLTAVFHQGACSDTMNCDGRFMMENNYQYSLHLLDFCQQEEIPLIYASSAAVYGVSDTFREERRFEKPANIYGYSKYLFDQAVRRRTHDLTAPVVGLRYFNTYGPGEQYKGPMASIAFQLYTQYWCYGRVTLFQGSGGFAAGEQSRDFIYIDDVINVNLYFLDHPEVAGVFNCGTGQPHTFNEVAVAVVNQCRKAQRKGALCKKELVEEGILEYLPFPSALADKYQNFTQADLTLLREAGFEDPFTTLEEGIARYVEQQLQADGRV